MSTDDLPEGHTGVEFCTLGMFIIDEIHFPAPRPSVYNIPGGAGTYAAIGARLFRPGPEQSRSVGWIVDAGRDFPDELRATIAGWETGAVVRETPGRLTTRGWNGYGRGERRAFEYTTPKLRLDEKSLTLGLLAAKVFHLICSPGRCIDLVKGISARRDAEGMSVGAPMFVWEPVPDLCVPGEMDKCYEALRCVDVVSPNHSELCGFFGERAEDDNGDVLRSVVEACSQKWLLSGVGSAGQGFVVVRAGREGCMVASRERCEWKASFYETPSGKVVDPTGGGNAFIGGFGIGLAGYDSIPSFEAVVEAASYGTVAASFAIEQVGLPKLGQSKDGETWNEDRVKMRLDSYRQRIQGSV